MLEEWCPVLLASKEPQLQVPKRRHALEATASHELLRIGIEASVLCDHLPDQRRGSECWGGVWWFDARVIQWVRSWKKGGSDSHTKKSSSSLFTCGSVP